MNLMHFKEFFKEKNNKMKVIVVVGLIGILLIMLSEFLPSLSAKKVDKTGAETTAKVPISTYKEQTEEDLATIIAKIEGVGKCAVMVTFETSAENVYAYNSTSEYGEKNEKREYNYIIIEDENKQEPIVVKEIQPKVKGVIIVCDGGDNSKVKEAVIDSVTSAFSIASNKISISKMANNKER